ncbi:MAG: hypothetical protein Q8P41_04620 [Pseudomonadota bacterium]|nr:hypothetical protein [Pseudomonadota bacterium]
MHLFLMAWLLLCGLVLPVRAADALDAPPQPDAGASALYGPAPDVAFKDTKSKEEKEEAMTASEKEAERKRKEKLARVIVLKWPDNKSVDYSDTTIQRNVKSRIARPDAQFFPEVDLYQNGRKVRDRTVVPAMQPAAVPDQNLQRVRQAVDEISGVPWNGMPPDQWGLKAQELRNLVEAIWFVDKVEQREPLFLLYTQIGRAAENQNQNVPPFYEQIGAQAVNYYFYLAATMAFQDPALMSKLTDQELNGAIGIILTQLQQGAFPNLKIDFEQEGEDFNAEKFAESYEIYLNGIKTDPSDDGQMDIFLGRTDIYLKRTDSGHGLSERLEVSKLEDKIYFVRDTARKKMGVDFIEQLFLHPNECTPALDGEILNYLAIYAKIHEKAEIYISVPQYGNPNRVWVWRYDRPSANLQLVGGGADGFPVRFALLVQGGIMYNTASVEYNEDAYAESLEAQGADPGFIPDPASEIDTDLGPSYVPVAFELRGHYNRLMVSLGTEFGFNTGGDDGKAQWIERYHTRGNPEADVAKLKRIEVPSEEDINEDGVVDAQDVEERFVATELLYNQVKINRNIFMGASVVLGRDAGIGFGPRLGVRVGWTNVPYALQTTAHLGMTLAPPGIKPLGDRVRPFVDVDGRVGASFPFATSLAHTAPITVAPVFGLTAGVGTTF